MLQSRTPSTHHGHGAPPSVRRSVTALLAVLAALALVFTAAISTAAPARAAVPDKLPITVTNDTGRSGLHLYVLGVDLTTGKLGG